MCNSIRKGHNPKLLLMLHLNNDTGKMETMGTNTRIVSNKWLCGFNQLKRKFVEHISRKIATRVSLIKHLTVCEIPGLTNDEIIEMKSYIACY